MPDHSVPFAELRDALLGLADAERARVADLVGAMHAPKPPISGALAEVLTLIGRLDPSDRRRFETWCARYLSRWGQVPVAASRRIAATDAKRERER